MNGDLPWVWVVLALCIGCAAVVIGAFLLMAFKPWYRAVMHGAQIPLPTIVMMRLRGHPVALLIDAYIELKQMGVPATIAEVERCYSENRHRVSTAAELAELIRKGHLVEPE